MEWSSNDVERRVLGALLEKSLAQPEYYPLTLNALVAACNQKNNRDPVMQLDEDTVYEVLEKLRERSLVIMVLPGAGTRTKRFQHAIDTYYRWDRQEQALMAELLLRGPQTVGELRTRAGRMVQFADLAAVAAALERLAGYDPSCVTELPRVPGQSAVRYRQMLYDEPAVVVPGPGLAAPRPVATGLATASTGAPRSDQLADRVADLTQALEHLAGRVARLEAELGLHE